MTARTLIPFDVHFIPNPCYDPHPRKASTPLECLPSPPGPTKDSPFRNSPTLTVTLAPPLLWPRPLLQLCPLLSAGLSLHRRPSLAEPVLVGLVQTFPSLVFFTCRSFADSFA